MMKVITDAGESRKLLTHIHQKLHAALKAEIFFNSIWRTVMRPQAKLRCPVCLENFQVSIHGCVMRCGHVFCQSCVNKFCKKGPTPFHPTSSAHCPLCRE